MPLYPPRREPLGFIHMVKTGGAWVGRVLRSQFGWRNVSGGHDPVWYETPANPLPKCEKLFGTIRDPWTWYCSLYRYAYLNNPTNVEHLKVWGRGSTSFRDVLYGWTHPGEAERFPDVLGVVFQPVDPAACKEQIRTCPGGFWSWSVGYFYGNGESYGSEKFAWKIDILLDMHNLREELEKLLGEAITVEEDQNGSGHIETPMGDLPYIEWYDAEMLEWVNEADGKLASQFNYTAKCL